MRSERQPPDTTLFAWFKQRLASSTRGWQVISLHFAGSMETTAQLEQLTDDGYCIVNIDQGFKPLTDAAEVINNWFEHRSKQQQQQTLADSATSDAATHSRGGYFRMPVKEVLEVREDWDCPGAPAELRLAVHTVC